MEGQLKKDVDEVPLPNLQAEHDALAENVNKLQSRVTGMQQSNTAPPVGLIEMLSTHWRKLMFVCSSRCQLDPEEFAQLQRARDKYRTEFVKRKRLCNDMIDAIMEGYPKSRHKLIEDTEIETDEAAGFNINQYKWTILNLLSLLMLFRAD